MGPHVVRDAFFSQDRVTVIQGTIDGALLAALLDPFNAYNQSYTPMQSLTIDHTAMAKAEMKLGGHFTKKLAKKGWLFKFENASTKVKLKTKTGATDPSYANSVIGTDLFWSMGVAVPQVTFAQMWINQVAQGFYLLYESIDEDFLLARFGSSSGNLYAGNGGTLEYLGDDPAPYEAKYSQESGSGNWSDLVALCKALNASDFSHIDMDSFVRHLAVEALFSFGDGFTCRGSNYYLYNAGNASWPYFRFVAHGKMLIARFPPPANTGKTDFDDSFGTKSTMNITQWAHVDLLKWGQAGLCNDKSSFLTLLAIAKFQKPYLTYLDMLLRKTWPEIEQRLDALYVLYAPYLTQDTFYKLDFSQNLDSWYSTRSQRWDVYLSQRKASASKQLGKQQ